MADPEHAMVFVDNHDNQRGHGGGGGLLTHDNPFGYKMGVAFMLAHDYGFKRVMSSYYFDDTDQGPPSTHPGKVGCGYPTWACEHRWATIGPMVQFTNAVAGTGVTNWNAGSDWVSFGRGDKGFFAMGSVDGDFDTGLPDGDYCDIVSECLQTITISGGRGHFKPLDGQEAPVVAICVGCGPLQPGTTSGPHPTSGTTTTRKPQPGTTATTKTPAPATTTTPDQPPATTEEGWCCDALVLSSSGGIKENYPELLGKYEHIGGGERPWGVAAPDLPHDHAPPLHHRRALQVGGVGGHPRAQRDLRLHQQQRSEALSSWSHRGVGLPASFRLGRRHHLQGFLRGLHSATWTVHHQRTRTNWTRDNNDQETGTWRGVADDGGDQTADDA